MSLGETEQAKLRALVGAGHKPIEVAKMLGVDRRVISAECARLGLNSARAWTDEMVEFMRPALERGAVAAEVAESLNEKFGTSFTRSAVIGKAFRAGIKVTQKAAIEDLKKPKKRKRDSRQDESLKAKIRSKREFAVSVMAPPTVAESPQTLDLEAAASSVAWGPGVGLLKAGHMHCRAVCDKVGSDGLAVFCGHPVHVRPDGTHTSWCAHHLRRYVDREFVDQALTGRPARNVRRAA